MTWLSVTPGHHLHMQTRMPNVSFKEKILHLINILNTEYFNYKMNAVLNIQF